MKNTKSLNTKKNIHLEFDIKRAVVEPDDDDSTTFIKNVLELNKKSPKDAEDLLMGKMVFEWDWSNGDADPTVFFNNDDSFDFQCTRRNTVLEIGEDDDKLVFSATVSFALEGKQGISKDELSEWLSDNSIYACGYIAAGWSILGSDGENIWVKSIDN